MALSAGAWTSASSLVLSEAVKTEFGNIGTNSTLFQPIFLGGCVIMLSGVVVAYIISLIIDKADLYESLSDELEGYVSTRGFWMSVCG
jgi:hypothetical protein